MEQKSNVSIQYPMTYWQLHRRRLIIELLFQRLKKLIAVLKVEAFLWKFHKSKNKDLF